jgi:REP element-mobilizing transposase RayT
MHFAHVRPDAFVVMPNHIHGVFMFTDHPDETNRPLVGARHAVPLPNPDGRTAEAFGAPVRGSLPTVVRSFKSAVTRQVNRMRGTPGASVWQRNYYEHIIRDEGALAAVREYICRNPEAWGRDCENPETVPEMTRAERRFLDEDHELTGRSAVPSIAPA